MIPVEPIEVINKRIKDHYGITEDKPNFRITWANDEYEHRWATHTDEGLELLFPEVRRLKKYPYIQDKYVLERLIEVPVFQTKELPEFKLSYEPLHVFEDKHGNPLPPAWIAAKWVIDQIHQQIQEAGLYTKYKHPLDGLNTEQLKEKKREEIKELQETLFGNETDVGDALAYKEGVGFTTSKIKES